MDWALIAIAAWLTVAALVGLFAWALARSAAIGDREEAEQAEFARAIEADVLALDRRSRLEDRRGTTRPWARSSRGRRTEDALRQELADAQRALKDAQDRLGEFKSRRSA